MYYLHRIKYWLSSHVIITTFFCSHMFPRPLSEFEKHKKISASLSWLSFLFWRWWNSRLPQWLLSRAHLLHLWAPKHRSGSTARFSRTASTMRLPQMRLFRADNWRLCCTMLRNRGSVRPPEWSHGSTQSTSTLAPSDPRSRVATFTRCAAREARTCRRPLNAPTFRCPWDKERRTRCTCLWSDWVQLAISNARHGSKSGSYKVVPYVCFVFNI